MAPINMKRYNTSIHEIPLASYTQPPGRTLHQHTGSLPRYNSTPSHPSVTSDDSQTFPIFPEQLEKHLEQVQQRLAYNIPVQPVPACGSTPSPSSDRILVLNMNSPAGTVPTVYAFHASTLGMPSTVEYLRFLTRYLDEMAPSKRGKALVDSELLRRIKLILTLQHNGSFNSGETGLESDSVPPTPHSTGGSWDTPAFRRWVRKTFVYRPATRAEFERATDFGVLSPPESSLSGPGVPGYAPSAGSARSINLIFHHDRPVALRSRIYKIILRAHWIANHAGRDRTWAVVREVCSYIPKCLVYDFVAACPTCRVARSKQYGMCHNGVPRVISVAEVGKLGEMLQHGFWNKGDEGNPNAGGRLPPIPPASSHVTSPEGWIPPIHSNDPFHPYPSQIPAHPLLLLNSREVNSQIVTEPTSDLPFGPVRLPPVTSVPCQATDRSQRSYYRSRDLRETQQETPSIERGQCPSRTLISKLIEAGSDQDMSVLEGSPALKRKDGLLAPEEGIGSAGANVGHGVMVSIFPSVALLGSLLTGGVRHASLHGRLVGATKIQAWR